ncbi:MAG: prepilin-type N-terminal cleavage/methylation domain-containing protein [Candidatus Pacebacteria bacterium]|nr:prepilin-type N-terminal cleavage/methylation domain-containing protein [Candidatus Paceibacterota bacterium]
MANLRARGFTLIELLVVIAIIGLLSSVILAALNTARNKAYDSSRKSNLVEVQKALELYYNDNGVYPQANGTYSNYASQCQVGGNAAQNSVITGLVSGGYIAQLPTDPQMVTSTNTCCYEYSVDATGANYKYMFFGCPTSAAGTGAMTDPFHVGAWSVYTPGAAKTL